MASQRERHTTPPPRPEKRQPRASRARVTPAGRRTTNPGASASTATASNTLSPGMKLDAHKNSTHPAAPQKGIAALGDFFFFGDRGEDGRRGAAPPATTTATRSGCRKKKRKKQKKRKRAQGLPVSAAGSEIHARSSPPPRYGQAVVGGGGSLKTQLRREVEAFIRMYRIVTDKAVRQSASTFLVMLN